MKSYSDTNIGRVREQNQDNYSNFLVDSENFWVFTIADGMGGHQSGEVASSITVTAIRDYIKSHKDENDYFALLKDAIIYANKQILDKGKEDAKYENMGTTVVVCLISESIAYIAHAGDSRLYLYRDGDLIQITKDHSYVQTLIDSGELKEDDPRIAQYKNIVTNALGVYEDIDISLESINLRQDDLILMATDGLTNMLRDETIRDILKRDYEPKITCEKLIDSANKLGGYDNITVTIVKMTE